MYNYIYGEGVDGAVFLSEEEEIVNQFGQPDSVDVDVYEKDIEFTKRFCYSKLGLMISISKYDNVFEPIKIFTKKLQIGNVDLYSLSVNELKKHLEVLSNDLNLDMELERSKDNLEEMLFYPKLGLTFWFFEGEMIDLCMELPGGNTHWS